MTAEKIATGLARTFGWVLILVSLYGIGGWWWVALAWGFLFWMPLHWFKE